MIYSTEDQKELERIFAVFSDYLKSSTHIDIVPSKVGYIMLPIVDGELSCGVEPDVIEPPADLCDIFISQIAYDVVEEMDKPRPILYEYNAEIRKKIRERIESYIKKLPEYRYLIDQLFINPHI